MIPNTRAQKFKIDLQKFKKFAAEEFFSNCYETEEELEENDDDFYYDQISLTHKFKFNTYDKKLSNMF